MDSAITPGEILLEECLRPMGISQNAMARAIGVSPRAVNEIIHGRRSITPAMSIRFGAFFGQSDEFWHGLQVECDFRKIAGERGELVAGGTASFNLEWSVLTWGQGGQFLMVGPARTNESPLKDPTLA